MQKIPPEVRDAITASDWERTIFNIGRAHKLHIDDIDVLSIETILTMIGLEHPKDFPENIKKRIGLSSEVLMDIVDEVNEQLFSKIREALKTHYEKQSAEGIMAKEEEDELYHAGISLEDDYQPERPKKSLATLVDQKLSQPQVQKVAEEKPAPPPAPLQPTPQEEKPSRPPLSFDPYREPIE